MFEVGEKDGEEDLGWLGNDVLSVGIEEAVRAELSQNG